MGAFESLGISFLSFMIIWRREKLIEMINEDIRVANVELAKPEALAYLKDSFWVSSQA